MERRAILAAVLMAGLLIAYQFLFVTPPPSPVKPQEKGEGRTAAAPDTTATAPSMSPPAAISAPLAPLPGPVPREVSPAPERTSVVETPLYRAVFGSNGGELKAWELNYRGVKPMVVDGLLGFRGIEIDRAAMPMQMISFALSPQELKLGGQTAEGVVRLTGVDRYGLEVLGTLRFHVDSYVVEQEISVHNRHTVRQNAEVVLPWVAPVEWSKDTSEKFQGQRPVRVVRSAAGSVTREDVHKLVAHTGDGQWIALESEWYVAAMIPQSPGWQLSERKLEERNEAQGKKGEMIEIALRAAIPSLDPGQSWRGKVEYYIGPKEYTHLKAVGVGLEKSIYFGGFPLPQAYGGLPMEWLAVPIMAVLRVFHKYTGNYGAAIILLTIITKVLFFPLTIKSMTSMRAMQALQPQINALRSKYKNDAQRLQRETMELYRANRVNPLGGCLPMIVQIPIFYALYVALSVSVEMQNARFICFGHLPTWVPFLGGQDLWICDLAAHDPTYLLPVLMGMSMFVQQKMQPVVGDPRQAKMMLFMPVLFTFMFLNLPSGLVLYWTVSNVLQIAQQKYMERASRREKPVPRALKKA